MTIRTKLTAEEKRERRRRRDATTKTRQLGRAERALLVRDDERLRFSDAERLCRAQDATRRWLAGKGRDYRERNRERIRERGRNYQKRHLDRDVGARLSARLRTRLYLALKNNTKTGSAVRDLGCTIPELKAYLEAKFQPGMAWDNWTIDGWHIDHRIPLASFDLTDRTQLLTACHYTNLQPLWAVDNLSKGATPPA